MGWEMKIRYMLFCGDHYYEISEGSFSITLSFESIQPASFLKNIKERVDFIHFFRNIFHIDRSGMAIQNRTTYFISSKNLYPLYSSKGRIIEILFGDNFHPSFVVNLREA